MKIQLTFRREDFWEIYFNNNEGNWLLNKTTKMSFYYVIITSVGVLYHYTVGYSIDIPIEIILLICGIVGFDFGMKFHTYYKWRESIIAYFQKNEAYKSSTIEITPTQFFLEQDDNLSIEKLDSIKTLKVEENYIYLEGSTGYTIPRKSMTEEEYQQLKVLLKDNIKEAGMSKL
ncbi:MAG: hypothetical protein U0U66_08520 [Cytophagaceae bacterium]